MVQTVENVALASQGAVLVGATSEHEEFPAENILDGSGL